VVNQAVDHIYTLRNEWELQSKLVLQIHDAIILEVPDSEVKIVYEELLPQAMVERVPIIGTDMNGQSPHNGISHHLGIDIVVSREWGKPIDDLSAFGINIQL
jgi:hypothetical protein